MAGLLEAPPLEAPPEVPQPVVPASPAALAAVAGVPLVADPTPPAQDGGVEPPKRKRGRPPGSKNRATRIKEAMERAAAGEGEVAVPGVGLVAADGTISPMDDPPKKKRGRPPGSKNRAKEVDPTSEGGEGECCGWAGWPECGPGGEGAAPHLSTGGACLAPVSLYRAVSRCRWTRACPGYFG